MARSDLNEGIDDLKDEFKEYQINSLKEETERRKENVHILIALGIIGLSGSFYVQGLLQFPFLESFVSSSSLNKLFIRTIIYSNGIFLLIKLFTVTVRSPTGEGYIAYLDRTIGPILYTVSLIGTILLMLATAIIRYWEIQPESLIVPILQFSALVITSIITLLVLSYQISVVKNKRVIKQYKIILRHIDILMHLSDEQVAEIPHRVKSIIKEDYRIFIMKSILNYMPIPSILFLNFSSSLLSKMVLFLFYKLGYISTTTGLKDIDREQLEISLRGIRNQVMHKESITKKDLSNVNMQLSNLEEKLNIYHKDN